jgi:hypothetical protein
MEVKGTFFAGRKAFITQQFGEPRWSQFIASLSEQEPLFGDPILVTTRVPVSAYLTFQEALIREFFDGNEEAYWTIGEKSAEWALTEGPYKSFRNNPQSVERFIMQSLPLLWSAYYTKGRIEVQLVTNVVQFRIYSLPVSHISFEYTVIGWVKKAMQMIGLRAVTLKRLQGISIGDREIEYRISFTPPPGLRHR